MRKALPLITEEVENLKQRLRRTYDARKKPRLQMLYLLASGQAQTRREVAQLLGVHRNTVGHWLAIYETGGLEALLAVYVPAGKPLSLSPEVLASIARPSRSRRALPPMKRCANGSSRPSTWTSTITHSTPSSGPGSGRSSKCRGRATQKKP